MPIADIGRLLLEAPAFLYTLALTFLPLVLVVLWVRDERRARRRD